jgi:nucleotide-binding universal stress UspA family protein
MKDSAPAPCLDTAPGLTKDRLTHPAVLLVATDLSDLDRLMPFALEQAAQTGARLLLLHVLTDAASLAADASGMPYYDPAGAFDFATKSLDPWCALMRRRNIACEALVRSGNPAQQIGSVARQFRADRVLLGTRSRSRLGKLFLGSVAEQVLRSVNLPVITVGPEAHVTMDASPLERVVLHATTLRENSRPSAALACQVAASLNAKLVLLHVLLPLAPARPDLPLENEFSPQGPGCGGACASLDSAAIHQLRELAVEAGGECGVTVEPRVVHGNPSIEILAEAFERRASLIVLGARHHSVLMNLTRDRTIYRVLAHAPCPVLTLREPQAKPSTTENRLLALHPF